MQTPTPTRPRLSLIAAVTSSGGIGKNNALLWHEPQDQKHFRQVTMDCPVIMGRKTWDSLPERFRPLPGRINIVMTRNRSWRAPGALTAHTFDEAMTHAADADKVFVIGGAEVYAMALPRADELVLTEIDADFDADTFFPHWPPAGFTLAHAENHLSADQIPYRFATYHRTKTAS